MNCTIIAALSKDGYIAKTDGDVSWPSAEDVQLLHDTVLKNDVLIMGQVTYIKHTKSGINDGKLRVVLTHTPNESKSITINTRFVDATLPDLLQKLKDEGHKSVLILGGSSAYKQAMQQIIAGTILLTVEPLTFGAGIPFYNIPFTGDLPGYKLDSKTPLNNKGTLLYTYTKVL